MGKRATPTKPTTAPTGLDLSNALVEHAYSLFAEEHTDTLSAFENAWSVADSDAARAQIAGGALNTYFCAWSDFVGLSRWQERWKALDVVPAADFEPLAALRYHCGTLVACRLSETSSLDEIDEESIFSNAISLIKQHIAGLPVNEVAIAIPILSEYCQVLRRLSDVQELELLVVRDRRFEQLSPIRRGRVWDWLSAAYYTLDDRAQTERCEANARQIAEAFGLDGLSFDLLKKPLRLAIEDGELVKATDLLAQMRTYFNPAHSAQATEYWDMQGRILLAQRDWSGARDAYRRALETAQSAETPINRRVVLWAMTAAVFVAMGRADDAKEHQALAVAAVNGPQKEILTIGLDLIKAWFAWQHGEENADAGLTRVVTQLAERNLIRFMRPLPAIAAQVCHVALEHNVAVDFCRRVIAARQLHCPTMSVGVWPHPLKVFSLGHFDLHTQGAPLPAQAKPPVKPLALLRLLAANEGMPLPVGRVLSLLWPDTDAARSSFDMALTRLKKLIGADNTVYLDNGQLVANREKVWFDTQALAELTISLDASRDANPVLLSRHATHLLRLYRGALLAGEPDEPWLLAARQRQQQRFLRAVDSLGQALERLGGHETANTLYERAIEVEPLAEALYRRLMAYHARRGDHAEALAVYRRCRQILSVTLSLPPSAATEALMKEVYAASTRPIP